MENARHICTSLEREWKTIRESIKEGMTQIESNIARRYILARLLYIYNQESRFLIQLLVSDFVQVVHFDDYCIVIYPVTISSIKSTGQKHIVEQILCVKKKDYMIMMDWLRYKCNGKEQNGTAFFLDVLNVNRNRILSDVKTLELRAIAFKEYATQPFIKSHREAIVQTLERSNNKDASKYLTVPFANSELYSKQKAELGTAAAAASVVAAYRCILESVIVLYPVAAVGAVCQKLVEKKQRHRENVLISNFVKKLRPDPQELSSLRISDLINTANQAFTKNGTSWNRMLKKKAILIMRIKKRHRYCRQLRKCKTVMTRYETLPSNEELSNIRKLESLYRLNIHQMRQLWEAPEPRQKRMKPDMCAEINDIYNKHSRKQTWPGLVICQVDELRGKGVRTTQFFPKDTIVCDYKGILLEPKERAEFYQAAEANANDEVLGQTEYTYNFKWRPNQFVDLDHYMINANNEQPTVKSFGRMINHCKHNNSVKPVVFTNSDDKPVVLFRAKRDLVIGEELCYDYGDRRSSALPDWWKNTAEKSCICFSCETKRNQKYMQALKN